MGIKVMYRFLAMTFFLLIEFVWCFFGLFSAAFVQITLKQFGSLVVFFSAAAADATSFIRVVSHVPCFDFRANIFLFGGVVQGLTKLLADNAPGAMKEQKFESYFGRRIAIDASMSIYQFLIVVGRTGNEMLTNEAGEVTRSVPILDMVSGLPAQNAAVACGCWKLIVQGELTL
jgi:hypothetical protein